MSSVDRKHFGIASSMLSSMRMMGQMASMAIVIFVLSLFVGNTKLGVANQDSFITSLHIIFGVFVVLCLIGVYASLVRGEIHKK